MQVSIRTLIAITGNGDLQGAAENVLGESVNDIGYKLKPSDVDSIIAELGRAREFLESATISQLDPFFSSEVLFSELSDTETALRLNSLRYEARLANTKATELFISLVKLLGI